MKPLVKLLMTIIVAALPMTAQAAPVIDFGTGSGGEGGTITGGRNITGSGIFIDKVVVAGAPFNNGAFDVEGPGVCGDGTGGCAVLSFDHLLDTMQLVGSIPELNILDPIPLLAGDFFGAVRQCCFETSVGFGFQTWEIETEAAELLAALGLDPATNLGIRILARVETTGPDSFNVVSAELTSSATPVPEPGSVLLLGTGLLGVMRTFRRNQGARA